MKIFSSLIRTFLFFALFFTGGVLANACTIQNGPSPLLVKYIQEIQKKSSEIKNFASANNKCNGTQGTFSNEKRAFNLVEGINLENPVSGSILIDFQYRIMLTAEGESRGPTTRDGTLIKNLETSTLMPALKSVSSACALDLVMSDGTTPQTSISAMLRTNRALESYFKNIALGNTPIPEGVNGPLLDLYNQIRESYSPEATLSCRGSDDIKNMEDVMAKIQERWGKQANKTKKAENDWQKALDLFAGKGKDTKEYQALQSQLLATELARQGLSKSARDAILGRRSCLQRATTTSSTPEEVSKEKDKCGRSFVQGADNLTNWMRPLALRALNTEEYLKKALSYKKAKQRTSTELADFWGKIQETKNGDEKLNDKMITDLVNIHAELVLTNKQLCKKSEEMYANCMKGQPEIPCPTVKCSKN